jgi:uncharacterized protein YjbI with pentapeptide repeats
MNETDLRQLIEEARQAHQALTLIGADFSEIDLNGLDFSRAKLKGTQFRACNLANCNFQGADLRGCRLVASNLNGANLAGAQLEGSDLAQAQLRGANLSGASLCRAHLTRTDLSGADLSGADLTGITFSPAYEHPELLGALCDGNTRWSENLDHIIKKHVIQAGEIIQRREEEQARLRRFEAEITRLQEAVKVYQQKLQASDQEKVTLRNLVETQRQKLEEEETRRRQLEAETAHLQQLLAAGRQKFEGWGSGETPRKFYFTLLNPIRAALGLVPLFVLPQTNISPTEQGIAERAYSLWLEVNQALNQNRQINPSKKSSLKQQARQVPENIANLLWKLSRLRRAKHLIGVEGQAEIEKLEHKLLAELQHSATLLEGVLTSTMRLDIARGDRPVERLLQDLAASNERLRDLADAYDEVKSQRI